MGIHHSPHIHTIPIPMGIPMGIPIPTAALPVGLSYITFHHFATQSPATFLQRSNSVVEELLYLVFQPSICRADFFLIVSKFASSYEFQLQLNNKVYNTVVPKRINQWYNVDGI